jgi:NAD(P)-dependent dehydrogenase (short-subunit alcohol dehydrogenase family)
MSALAGKVAFITGAARGQGRAEAIRLATDGASIIAIDICDQIASVPYPMATSDDFAATVKLVEDTGARIIAREADVRDSQSLESAVDAGLDAFGRPASSLPIPVSLRWRRALMGGVMRST